MTTITLTFHDGEEDRFKRTLFADEAWASLSNIDAILTANHSEPNRLKTLDAVRDVLADVLWRVE